MNIFENKIKMNPKSTVVLYVDIAELIFVTSVQWIFRSFIFIDAPNSTVQEYSSRESLNSYSAGEKIPEPVSQNYGVKVCTESFSMRVVPAGGSCEDGNKLTGYIKFGELLD
jgi:hypothetical protein